MWKNVNFSLILVVLTGCSPSRSNESSVPVFRNSTCSIEAPKKLAVKNEEIIEIAIPGAVGIVDKEDFIRLINGRRPSAAVSVDANVLTYQGQINNESVNRAVSVLSANGSIKRLRINSIGGSTDAALKLHAAVSAKRLEVEVFGSCASACADFVIAAGSKVILDGPVLFHGTTSGCIRRLGSYELVRRVGFFGFISLQATAKREEQIWESLPKLRALSLLAAAENRGDPSGAKHDFMDVCPSALKDAGLNVSLAPTYAARYRASTFLATNSALAGRSLFNYCGT